MNIRTSYHAFGMACVLATSVASADQGLRTQRIIIAALAVEAAQTAVKFCAGRTRRYTDHGRQ